MERILKAFILRGQWIGFLVLIVLSTPHCDEFKVHLLSPWLADPARADKIPHLLSNEIGPGHPGAPMTATGDGWYTYTWNLAKAPEPHVTFFFASYIPNPNYAYDQAQQYINGGQNFRFGDTFLAWDVREIWIIPQGPGKPPVVTDIPQVKKVAYLFNPWPLSAPTSRVNATSNWNYMRPSKDPARCGWYLHHFIGAERTLFLKSALGNQFYGTTGMGGVGAIDLAKAFETADTVFIAPEPFPGGPPRILTRIPEGMSATCSFPVAVTVRDFSAKHPDFERGQAMGNAVIKNMVMPTLGPDKKPVKGPNPHTFQSRFDDWFRTQSSQANPDLNNHEACKDLTLSKDAKGYWAYDSYLEPSKGYFPIDDFNRFGQTYKSNYKERGTGQWKETNGLHNFHFCMEMHAQFEYKKGQVFKFEGDDDVWVYIDNKLAIDLGGAHEAASDTVDLDKLGLSEGSKYDFDMFYCERQTTSSNLLMQTSIFFEQEQTLFAKKTLLAGQKVQYDIFEILSGDKSCGAVKGGDTVVATSIFKLNGPSVTPAALLPTGVSYGGIAVNAGKTQVTVDTSLITGLRPGVYTVSFTSERSGKGGFIQFTVSGSFGLDFVDKRENLPAHPGDVSAVSIQTLWNGVADARPDTVLLKPQAGLLLFADSAMTLPIAPNAPLVLPATGNQRLYVGAATPGVYSLELIGGKGLAIAMDKETFTFVKKPVPPIAVETAWYQDLDGDGRIETVSIRFAKELPVAPARLAFHILDARGMEARRSAAGVDIKAAGALATVTLADPFPFGITSVANAGNSGTLFDDDGVPTVGGPFAVDDSVAPVILKAETLEPDSTRPNKQVLFEVSEPMDLPLLDPSALIFKRDAAEFTAAQLRLLPTVKTGARTYAAVVDTTSEVFPIVGDSLALSIGGLVKDALGNAPARKTFVRIGGTPPKAKPMRLYVTFPNGSRDQAAAGTPPQGPARFIPVDSHGASLPGIPRDGKCPACPAMEGGNFVGPVFHVETYGPVDYTFKVFTNTGEFVAAGQGRIGEADLPLLPKRNDASGIRYTARVVWTGNTAKGRQAGTGAYVLIAALDAPKDLRTGAGPSREDGKIRFGMLRGL